MTGQGKPERPDPLSGASRVTVEIDMLREDLERARKLIADNEWNEGEGLLNVFVSGLQYLLGEARLRAAVTDYRLLVQQLEESVKELMLYQSMYAVMKYRAFTLSEAQHALEGKVAGLEAAERFASARLKTFREDEKKLRAERRALQEENAQLQRRLAAQETLHGDGKDKESGPRQWRLWKRQRGPGSTPQE